MHYINQFLYQINTGGVSETGRQINILFVIKTTGFIVLLLHSLSIWFVTSVDRNYAGCFLANCSSIKVPYYWQTWQLCLWCTIFQIWKEPTKIEMKVLNNCTRTVYFTFALHYSVQILWYLELVVCPAQRTYQLVKSTITAHQTIFLPLVGGGGWSQIKQDTHYELKRFKWWQLWPVSIIYVEWLPKTVKTRSVLQGWHWIRLCSSSNHWYKHTWFHKS
jgi:hypothetical protein